MVAPRNVIEMCWLKSLFLGRKTKNIVLFVFNESWFASSHIDYFSSQTFVSVSSGARSLPERKYVCVVRRRIRLNLHGVEGICAISFIYNKNKSAPSIDPCGTETLRFLVLILRARFLCIENDYIGNFFY